MPDFEFHWEQEWRDELAETSMTWEEIEAAKVLLEAAYEEGVKDGRKNE